MISPQRQSRCAALAIAGLVAFGQTSPGQENSAIKVNPAAIEFARQLIRDGHVVLDKRGAWRQHQPSVAQKTEFLYAHGAEEYGKWHLGLDSRHRIGSKGHYKFPFGDFTVLHRCGLLAIRARAHEYGYAEIETAAEQLLQMIESPRPARQKRIDEFR